MTATAESPAAVPPPPRPVTVTIAFWLQLAAALILLGLAALVVVEAIQWDAAIDRAVRQVPDADPNEVRAERVSSITMSVILGVPALALGLWMALTAPGVRQGSNTARIMFFVAGGAQLLFCFFQACAGMFFVPLIAFGAVEEPYYDEDLPPDGDFWQESDFFETLYGEPSVSEAVIFSLAGFGVMTVLLLTATVVLLLALPPANRWFVPKPEPEFPSPLTAGGDIPHVYLAAYYPPPGYLMPPGHLPPGAYPAVPGHPGPAGYPAAPGYPNPAGHPAWSAFPTTAYPASGYPAPPGYPPPPGTVICPDPSAHVAPDPAAPPPPAAAPTPPAAGEPSASSEPPAAGEPSSAGSTPTPDGDGQDGAAPGGSGTDGR